VDALPPEAVTAQIQAVISDIGVRATKTGMLLNPKIIAAVAVQADQLPNLVVDPVMVSRAGAQLITDQAIATLREQLIPQAQMLTPNRAEAEILSGLEIQTLAQMQAAAEKIHKLGPKAVLVKGGGMGGELRGVDVWYDGTTLEVLPAPRVETTHTHGTGCTLSAAIAANLALGIEPFAAVKAAKEYVTRALHHSLAIGQGQGPVGHFFPLLEQ
jgi:hydroxymethylpyrimidine/phosphomethylpyrimidine kinase